MTEHRTNLIYTAIFLVLITVSSRATNNMVTTTVPLLGKYVLHFSNTVVGLLSTVIFAFTFLSTSYINPSLNATTRKRVFIISNGFIVLSLLLYYYSSPMTVWILSAVAGLAFGLVMPNLITAASLANDKKSAERLLALYSTSLSLSLIIGPALETFLLTKVGYREIFLWFIPLALIAFILSARLKFPDVKREDKGIAILRNKGFISSVLSITTYNIPFAAFTTFLAILAKERFNIPDFEAYSVFLPFFTISFLTRLSMTIKPFSNLKVPLVISIGITIIGLLGILYAPSYTAFLAVIALLGIPHGSIFPMSTIMISRATSIAERNAVNSYFLAYNNILFLAVPAIVGFISTFIGLTLTMTLLVIPVFITALMFFSKYWNDEILKG
ncbi:MFS transporter [Stygiolobus caldivivus]|uniref:MFS transporter n=1 Tax=Stygiolobus caldivivus TaxID=2824673 RepID=A0A8D5U9K7_9CREN|nr:MFS transporter [Stygiolobus caldivivus]BCU71452.1 MFS transporter [Stygiolobus caldivivus]